VTKVEGLKVADPMNRKKLMEQIRVKTLLWLSAIADDDGAKSSFPS
jgi:hypothetical protein